MSNSNDDNPTKARTSKNITRGRGEAVGETFSRTERCSARESQSTGIQGHVPDDQGTSIRGYRAEFIQSTRADPGKILEAVKLIEEKHLSYVRAHQQRLIFRLDESMESENDFKRAIQELEAQIHQLILDKKEPE